MQKEKSPDALLIIAGLLLLTGLGLSFYNHSATPFFIILAIDVLVITSHAIFQAVKHRKESK